MSVKLFRAKCWRDFLGVVPKKKRLSDINAFLPSIFKMQKLLTVFVNNQN